MSFLYKVRLFSVLLVVLIFAGTTARAQGILSLTVTSSASSLLVSNNLTYTIKVTNNYALLPSAVVSNSFPSTVRFISATPSLGGTFTTNASGVVFNITAASGFNIGTIAQMTLTVRPTQVGFVTNLVEFYTPNATNDPSATLVTHVTNTIPPRVNIGVAISVPATAVIVNDSMTYGVSVTNAGPSAAPNVALTNTLPAGVSLKNVSPASPVYTVAGSNLIFNLGPLSSGAFTNFQFTLQPTNAGVLIFFASVGASDVIDTNTANNTASNSLTVITYLAGDLVAVTNSAQIINPQNGLIEQSVLVSNVGTNAVPAVRLVVTGLTNRLANAVATNSGSPYVVYAAPLAASSSVTLLLQYAPRKNFPFTNSQLQAYAVPPPDQTPPAGTVSVTNIPYTRIVWLTNNLPLIEFPAVLGRTYTIVYSDNLLFSNAMIAPPAIVAPGSQVHWIDYGPPTTVSVPPGSGPRFYKIYLNP